MAEAPVNVSFTFQSSDLVGYDPHVIILDNCKVLVSFLRKSSLGKHTVIVSNIRFYAHGESNGSGHGGSGPSNITVKLVKQPNEFVIKDDIVYSVSADILFSGKCATILSFNILDSANERNLGFVLKDQKTMNTSSCEIRAEAPNNGGGRRRTKTKRRMNRRKRRSSTRKH